MKAASSTPSGRAASPTRSDCARAIASWRSTAPLRDAVDFQFYAAEEAIRLDAVRGEASIVFNVEKHPTRTSASDSRTRRSTACAFCNNACFFCFLQGQPEGSSQDALRQGRRLPPELRARQLRDVDEPHRSRLDAPRRAAPVAAQRLRTRHRAGAKTPDAREQKRPDICSSSAARLDGHTGEHAGGALPRRQRR